MTNTASKQSPNSNRDCSLWKVEGVIQGSQGSLDVPDKISRLNVFVLTRSDGQVKHYRFEGLGNGYSYEAVEVRRCLQEERLESELVPLEESVAVLRTMDQLRVHWNLRFPGEYTKDARAYPPSSSRRFSVSRPERLRYSRL